MYLLNKYIHPENFTFYQRLFDSSFKINRQEFTLNVRTALNDVYHLTISNDNLWKENYYSELNNCENISASHKETHSTFESDKNGMFSLKNNQGKVLLQSVPGKTFGIADQSWLICFTCNENMRFYGMGQKSTPFEKSGITHIFWNVDMWYDHHTGAVAQEHLDPDYIAVPYLIIKQENEYIGLLLDTPVWSIISTGEFETHVQREGVTKSEKVIYCGAERGKPSLYLIYGPTLRELTQKFQKLVGTVPLPPLWALGFHQSRWGYASMKDLTWLIDNFKKHEIPADGLWVDIDYMDEFRVFTFNHKHFSYPEKDIARIQNQGYHVVPIIDPGVKKEPGYEVYDSGKKADIFCKNPAQSDFTGIVWPGYTVFPDFSLDEGRAWWREQVSRFLQKGIKAAWLDMNEPATGAISCMDMLFGHGKQCHEAFHNLYGMLMAKASREGFEKVYPHERIFLLSRSGFTGSQKYAANWSGDNFSNYFHLAMSIPKSINLSLSGMPFNGPDVGGFGNDTYDQLMIDWIKAGFLFPFFRNHTSTGSKKQEPWSLSSDVLRISRRFIQLRYKLLPYLYNLFIEHNRNGDPIIRPLFYEFDDSQELSLEKIDDQFMIGPALMQAPFVREKEKTRTAILPAGSTWYRADKGIWLEGGREITIEKDRETTPIFIRDGSIVPMQKGVRKNNRNDLTAIELLICLSPQKELSDTYIYCCDDGISFDYKEGKRSEYVIKAQNENNILTVNIEKVSENYVPVSFICVTVSPFKKLILGTEKGHRELYSKEESINYFGRLTAYYYWI
jgi:alpha-glucosidase